LIGLQARSREWRRKECFQVLKDYNSKINSISKDSSNIAIEQGSFHNENMNNSTPDLKMNRKSVVFATAHHADDQHETIMLKFLRGAYISNLQPVRCLKYNCMYEQFYVKMFYIDFLTEVCHIYMNTYFI
jgi:tRNA(Ile)-lysidine synthase TilS/MesJ